MKSCGFEILAEALEKRPCLVRIPFQFQEAIDRIHPEPDRLEMEGGDGPSKGLGFLDNLIAGGAWIKGRYVPSILAAIGGVIERHLIEIGFIGGEGLGLAEDPAARRAAAVSGGGPVPEPCPRCGGFNRELREGCEVCLDCGHSKCE